MIGGALVGTFLGVFLAYGLVGPFAARLKEILEEEGSYYRIIQSVLVAHLHGNAAQISVEIGRGSVPSGAQPSFLELEEALSAIPNEAYGMVLPRRASPEQIAEGKTASRSKVGAGSRLAFDKSIRSID